MPQEVNTTSKSTSEIMLASPTTSNLTSIKVHQKEPVGAVGAQSHLQENNGEPSRVRDTHAPSSTRASDSNTLTATGSHSSSIQVNMQEAGSTDGLTATELREEATIAKEIGELWCSEIKKKRSVVRTRKELFELRNNLSERLYSYKLQLACTGRGGRWALFLKQADIPRATADRYVNTWKRSLDPLPEKRLTEAFTAPTDEEIENLARTLKPKLTRVLTTVDSVTLFLEQLKKVLQESTAAE